MKASLSQNYLFITHIVIILHFLFGQYPGLYHILYILIASDSVFHDQKVVTNLYMHNWLLITIVISFNKKYIIWEPSFHIHYYYVCFLHLTMSSKKEIKTKKSISTFFGRYLNSNYAFLWSLYIDDRVRT